MSTLHHSYRGLSLLLRLNLDLLIILVVLAIAMLSGAFMGSLIF